MKIGVRGEFREERVQFISLFKGIKIHNINEINFQQNKCITFANTCGILSMWFLFEYFEFLVVEKREDFVQVAADVLQKLREM